MFVCFVNGFGDPSRNALEKSGAFFIKKNGRQLAWR